jgi:hypothetical protein
MFEHTRREAWILLLLGIATLAPAHADGPRAGFKLDQEATVFISPDKKVRVEQYAKDNKDTGLLYQFWTFDADHRHAFLLNPGEGDDLAGYAAGFRFSPDSQWLVRMQKLGAGYQTLFLYRRNGYQFSPATTKPLGDLAWDYFFPTPDQRGCIETQRTRIRSDGGIFGASRLRGQQRESRRVSSASMSFTGVRAGSRHSKS